MVRTVKMSLNYKRKNILRSVPLCLLHRKLPYWKLWCTWSFNSSNHCIIFFQPDTNCGLLGMLSTDIAYLVIHNWHGKRTTEGHFCPKKFYPLWERNEQWILFSTMLLFLIVPLSGLVRIPKTKYQWKNLYFWAWHGHLPTFRLTES